MKIIRIFLGILLVFAITFTAVYGKDKISTGHSFGNAGEYKGIITVWHVDSFEGGIGSRKQFLLKVARSFEKQNEGVLVMVIEHTETSVKTSFEEGQYPDLISFGNGTEIKGGSQLKINTNNQGGKVGEKLYSVPWCRGGYVIIANPKLVNEFPNEYQEMLVSQGEYTQPTLALLEDGIKVNSIKIKKPMDAYVEFVLGKTPFILGTQRDVHRLERRGFEVKVKPLNSYNDLYQYVSVTSTDTLKSVYAEKFIEHLLNEKNQKNLSSIGMMSCFYTVDYDNIHLKEMQNLKEFKTISAFTPSTVLKEMQSISLKALEGNTESQIKIKNMLV